jgi:hypothetical protein
MFFSLFHHLVSICVLLLQALTMHYQSYANIIKLVLAVDEAQFPDAHHLLDDFDQSLMLIKEAASQKQKDT